MSLMSINMTCFAIEMVPFTPDPDEETWKRKRAGTSGGAAAVVW